MNYVPIISTHLKKLREIKCMKQSEIATILHIKQPYYSQLENGTKKISLEQLLCIADTFDLPLDWFTGRDVETTKRLKHGGL